MARGIGVEAFAPNPLASSRLSGGRGGHAVGLQCRTRTGVSRATSGPAGPRIVSCAPVRPAADGQSRVCLRVRRRGFLRSPRAALDARLARLGTRQLATPAGHVPDAHPLQRRWPPCGTGAGDWKSKPAGPSQRSAAGPARDALCFPRRASLRQSVGASSWHAIEAGR